MIKGEILQHISKTAEDIASQSMEPTRLREHIAAFGRGIISQVESLTPEGEDEITRMFSEMQLKLRDIFVSKDFHRKTSGYIELYHMAKTNKTNLEAKPREPGAEMLIHLCELYMDFSTKTMLGIK